MDINISSISLHKDSVPECLHVAPADQLES